MQYSEYMANYQAQKERQAQLVDKYSDKPSPTLNKALWSVTTVERHAYPDIRLGLRLLTCALVLGGIVLAWCALA